MAPERIWFPWDTPHVSGAIHDTSADKVHNRPNSGRIKRSPSQCAGIEMEVGIFIMVLESYIPAEHSQEERFCPSLIRLAQPRCGVQKPNQVAVGIQVVLLYTVSIRM